MNNTRSNSPNHNQPQPLPLPHIPSWPPYRPRIKLPRSALLRLAIIVNSLADSAQSDLPLAEVHAAAREGRLLELLVRHSGRLPDFSFLQSPPGTFDEVNSALRDSSVILQGREFPKVGVRHNGYCLALALVFYAIRERSPQLWPEHVPSEQN